MTRQERTNRMNQVRQSIIETLSAGINWNSSMKSVMIVQIERAKRFACNTIRPDFLRDKQKQWFDLLETQGLELKDQILHVDELRAEVQKRLLVGVKADAPVDAKNVMLNKAIGYVTYKTDKPAFMNDETWVQFVQSQAKVVRASFTAN